MFFTCHEIMDSLLNTSTSPTDDITENAPKICKTIETSYLTTMMKNMKGGLIMHLKYILSKGFLYISLVEYSAKEAVLFDHNSGLP